MVWWQEIEARQKCREHASLRSWQKSCEPITSLGPVPDLAPGLVRTVPKARHAEFVRQQTFSWTMQQVELQILLHCCFDATLGCDLLLRLVLQECKTKISVTRRNQQSVSTSHCIQYTPFRMVCTSTIRRLPVRRDDPIQNQVRSYTRVRIPALSTRNPQASAFQRRTVFARERPGGGRDDRRQRARASTPSPSAPRRQFAVGPRVGRWPLLSTLPAMSMAVSSWYV